MNDMVIFMKKIFKFLAIVPPAAVILFSIAACAMDNSASSDDERSENPYLGNILDISGQQVWTRNRLATKVSQAYLPHDGNHYITALFYTTYYNPATNYYLLMSLAAPREASGIVSGGILKFAVQDRMITNEMLLRWDNIVCPNPACDYGVVCDYVKCYNRSCDHYTCPEEHDFLPFRAYFREWKNVRINPSDTKGNVAFLMSQAVPAVSGGLGIGGMDRQKITGTGTTVTCETIMYFYVTKDCEITGEYDTGYIPGNYYFSTEGSLNLTLKEGWNLVLRRETYGTNFNGHARIGMEIRAPIKNPEQYKWTIEQGFSF